MCMYVCICSDAFDLNFGVVIFRLRAGFDATEKKDDAGGITIRVYTYNYVSIYCVNR